MNKRNRIISLIFSIVLLATSLVFIMNSTIDWAQKEYLIMVWSVGFLVPLGMLNWALPLNIKKDIVEIQNIKNNSKL